MRQSVSALYESLGGRLRRAAGRWRRAREGVTALEFAMVAPALFLVVTAIIEVALITFSTGTLRTGVNHAGRQIRVGQAQCFTDQDIIKSICAKASFLPQCLDRIAIERAVFPVGFAGEGVADGETHPSDVVLIGATYRWKVVSPGLNPFFADDNGDFKFRQSFVFKTEEYIVESCE